MPKKSKKSIKKINFLLVDWTINFFAKTLDLLDILKNFNDLQ